MPKVMGEKTEGLNVRELLKSTYSTLTARHNPQQIVLANRALAEIASDSDWHRTRVGYMGYENAGLFQFNGKTWAIARGEKCGSYPAEPYDSDILALELLADRKTPEQIQEELSKGIGQGSYFKNSLIFGMANGNLSLNKEGRFGEEMLKRLQPEIERFIAQEPEYDRSVILLLSLQHPATKLMLYKPEFADFLADSIEAVLK